MSTTNPSVKSAAPPNAASARVKIAKWWIWRSFAVLTWSYIILKLFVVDIDTVVLGAVSPRLIPFRFLIVVTTLLLLALLLTGKTLPKVFLFVMFYPFILCFDVILWSVSHRSPVFVLIPMLGTVLIPFRPPHPNSWVNFGSGSFPSV